MNDARTANKVVVGGFFMTVLLITANDLYVKKKAPTPAAYVGAAVAYFILGIVADFAPGVANGLSILTVIGFALSNSSVLGKLPGGVLSAAGAKQTGSGAATGAGAGAKAGGAG